MIRLLQKRNKILENTEQQIWWNQIHLIAILGLFLRLIVVFLSDNIHQSDEILQYLEQAHRLEFGYGIIPWEYRHGIRSWILPGFLTGLLHIVHILHIDDPSIYIPIIKGFFCIISISLIYCSYIITRNIASENAGRLASLLTCFWYELIYFASKSTPEVLSTYCLLLATLCVVVKFTPKNPILFGFLCGLSLILRLPYLPLVFVLTIIAFLKWRKKAILISGIGFFLVIMAAGYIDYLTWGHFGISFYNNYQYNQVYGVSKLFGESPATYFLQSLMLTSGGLFLVVGILSFFPSRIAKTWLPLVLILSIIIPHSLISHKEHRFIFAAIPLLMILTAIIISDFTSQVKRWKPRWHKALLYLLISIVLSLSVKGLAGSLPFQNSIYKTPILSRQPVLSAYLFLYKDPDLTTIFNNYSRWSRTGGYYYLHRNIPIYYQHQFRHNQKLNKIIPDDYSLYFSHIICHRNYQPIPNFITIFESGNLEIRKVANPPQKYIKLNIDHLNLKKPGIDNRYQPKVKPFI